jgi:hypothetical protein
MSRRACFCSIGSRGSAVRRELVECLRRISMTVRRRNRDIVAAIFGQFRGLFPGSVGGFAPKGDTAGTVCPRDQKTHGRPHTARYSRSPESGPYLCRLTTRQGAVKDQTNAKATKPEQSITTPVTARKRSTARKLLEANSSRMVHHLSRAPARMERLSGCTVKRFPVRKLKFVPG